MTAIVPAVLPTSRKDLDKKLALFTGIESVRRIQIDVVDGRFATPASWPCSAPPTPKATAGHSEATKGTPYSELEVMVQKGEMLPHADRVEYEIDLMCFDGVQVAGAWLAVGASRLTFHVESVIDPGHLLSAVQKRHGEIVSYGLAINISSSLSLIEPYLDSIEYVQFMGIAEIGKQGQPFDARVLNKISVFRSKHPSVAVQVDGGVSIETAQRLIKLGVSSLVVGSALLRAENPRKEFGRFEELTSSFGV